ncbi:MAG: hypothetical protein WC315_00715 [Candidatus Omnitrophota bacterium]|jgi:hypothetical protein
MRFILRDYADSEVADIAVADTPAELFDNISLLSGRIWRVIAEHDSGARGEDVAVIDLTTGIHGYNVFNHQTVSHADHMTSAVCMVRNLLQHYYVNGKLNDHVDLLGVRVCPA